MRAGDGSTQKIRVGLGDHISYPISYSLGAAPRTGSEIAISRLYAEDLEKTVGDDIILMIDNTEKKLTICGVYSDITGGGRTAQAAFETNAGDVLSVNIAVTYRRGADADAVTERLRAQFPFAKIYSVAENLAQTFGPMINAIKLASYTAIGVTVLLTVLVTALFMKMLVAKDRYPIAILKSLGFTGGDISWQYITRSAIVLVLGVVIGTILANTLGEYAGVAIISAFGASTFTFVVNPWFAYLLSPLLIATCVYAATLLGTADIRPLRISDHIKEA
jgi:putative ABC transport system permease protein